MGLVSILRLCLFVFCKHGIFFTTSNSGVSGISKVTVEVVVVFSSIVYPKFVLEMRFHVCSEVAVCNGALVTGNFTGNLVLPEWQCVHVNV